MPPCPVPLQQMYNEMNPAMRNLPEVVEAIEKSHARRAELRVRFLKSLHRLQQLMAAYAIALPTEIKPIMAAAKSSVQLPSPVVLKPTTAAKPSQSFSAMLAPAARPAAPVTRPKNAPTPTAKAAPKQAAAVASPAPQLMRPMHGLHDKMMPSFPVFSAPMSSMPPSPPSAAAMPAQAPVMYVPIVMSGNPYGTFMMPMQGANGAFSGMAAPGMGGFGGMWPMMPQQQQQQFAPQGFSMFPGGVPQFALQQSFMQQQQQHPMPVTHAVEVIPPSALPLSKPL